MDTTEILRQIIAERDKLNSAIASLQAISAPPRRGRPPKNLLATAGTPTKAAAPIATKKRGRRKRTKAQREAQAERMKQYWAKRKKQADEKVKTAASAKKMGIKRAKKLGIG